MIKYHIVSLDWGQRWGYHGITALMGIYCADIVVECFGGLPILHLPEILMILFVNSVMHVCRVTVKMYSFWQAVRNFRGQTILEKAFLERARTGL